MIQSVQPSTMMIIASCRVLRRRVWSQTALSSTALCSTQHQRSQHTAPALYVTAFADGACRGNPGLGGCGALLVDNETQTVLASRTRFLGTQETNNTAEYQGLLLALELAEEQRVARLRICMDSELVIKQMKGLYRVKARHLQVLHSSCTQRCKDFDSVEFVHVPRNENSLADRLANQAIDNHHPSTEN